MVFVILSHYSFLCSLGCCPCFLPVHSVCTCASYARANRVLDSLMRLMFVSRCSFLCSLCCCSCPYSLPVHNVCIRASTTWATSMRMQTGYLDGLMRLVSVSHCSWLCSLGCCSCPCFLPLHSACACTLATWTTSIRAHKGYCILCILILSGRPSSISSSFPVTSFPLLYVAWLLLSFYRYCIHPSQTLGPL